MYYSFSDEMVKAAVVRVDRYMLDALPQRCDIEHNFSLDFERKMRLLIRSQNNQRRKLMRKRYVAVLAAIIVLLASLMSVSAIRQSVFDFIVEKYEKFTHIFFIESQGSVPDVVENEFVAYTPTYIPDGFQLKLCDISDSVFLEYVNGDHSLSFSQQKLREVSMDINTEGVDLENVNFNGLSAQYYSNKGMQNLMWHDDTYMYMVSSTLQKEAIVKIAESIKPVT